SSRSTKLRADGHAAEEQYDCRFGTRYSLRPSDVRKEPHFYGNRGSGDWARHWRQHRHLQRRQCASAPTVALQKSRSTRRCLGERNASRFSQEHTVAGQLSRLAPTKYTL